MHSLAGGWPSAAIIVAAVILVGTGLTLPWIRQHKSRRATFFASLLAVLAIAAIGIGIPAGASDHSPPASHGASVPGHNAPVPVDGASAPANSQR